MPNWFIDIAASGTGSGDTAANAATNIVSFSSVASLEHGDAIWVRRTYTHTLDVASQHQLGKAGWTRGTNSLGFVIGWPASGQPFYADRPADARSAGWDSDTNSHHPNPGLPTFVYSGGSGSRGWGSQTGWGLANVHIVHKGVDLYSENVTLGANASSPIYNLHILGPIQFVGNINSIIELTWTGSINATLVDAAVQGLEKLTITQSSVVRALFDQGAYSVIRQVVTESSSVGHILEGFGASIGNETRIIHELIGNPPVNGDMIYGGAGSINDRSFIGNWYGLGPRLIGYPGGYTQRVVTSAQANYGGQPVSQIVTNSGEATTNFANSMLSSYPEMYARVPVESGVGIEISWPVWFDQTWPSPTSHGGPMLPPFQIGLMCESGGIVALNSSSGCITVGSADGWSGTLKTAAGSAFNLLAAFTPGRTGHAIAYMKTGITNTRTGYLLIAHQPDVRSF